MFKLVSESSVASGVRRISGVTGTGVLEYIRDKEMILTETAKALKVSKQSDIPHKASQALSEISEKKKEIETLNSKLASGRVDEILSSAVQVASFKVATADLGDTVPDAARALADKLRDKCPSVVAVFALHTGDRLNFVVSCGSDAVKAGAHAGKIAGATAAVCGGKGGGRPDAAMSGGKDVSKISEALSNVESIVKNI